MRRLSTYRAYLPIANNLAMVSPFFGESICQDWKGHGSRVSQDKNEDTDVG
jgi:hypothetical protein